MKEYPFNNRIFVETGEVRIPKAGEVYFRNSIRPGYVAISNGLGDVGYPILKEKEINSMIKKAMEFANKAHSNKMYDEFPYFKHLQDVYNIIIFVERYKNDVNLCCASWLHDTMEDTGTSYSDLKNNFNEEIAEIVYCVTDSNEGRNRKEKKLLTYPKIAGNPDAIVIKLADRIANMEHSLKQGKDSSFFEMYRKEYKLFRWNLFKQGHAEILWKRLDDLMEWKGW